MIECRNRDLIRDILRYIEATPAIGGLATAWVQAPKTMPGYESGDGAQIVAYHIDLCEQAGYIKRTEPNLIQLTWDGHEALKTTHE